MSYHFQARASHAPFSPPWLPYPKDKGNPKTAGKRKKAKEAPPSKRNPELKLVAEKNRHVLGVNVIIPQQRTVDVIPQTIVFIDTPKNQQLSKT